MVKLPRHLTLIRTKLPDAEFLWVKSLMVILLSSARISIVIILFLNLFKDYSRLDYPLYNTMWNYPG